MCPRMLFWTRDSLCPLHCKSSQSLGRKCLCHIFFICFCSIVDVYIASCPQAIVNISLMDIDLCIFWIMVYCGCIPRTGFTECGGLFKVFKFFLSAPVVFNLYRTFLTWVCLNITSSRGYPRSVLTGVDSLEWEVLFIFFIKLIRIYYHYHIPCFIIHFFQVFSQMGLYSLFRTEYPEYWRLFLRKSLNTENRVVNTFSWYSKLLNMDRGEIQCQKEPVVWLWACKEMSLFYKHLSRFIKAFLKGTKDLSTS